MSVLRRKIAALITASMVVSILSGCNISSLLPGKGQAASSEQKSGEENKENSEQSTQASNSIPAEDKKIKELINQYILEMYSQPAESYLSNNVTGTITENLKRFVAHKTIDEGNNNPEIGIHMPRFVQLNGLNAMSYEIINYKNKENKNIPEIEAVFYEGNGTAASYYVKVNLKAKCFSDVDFNTAYKENAMLGTYEKIGEVNEAAADYIKLQAKYEFEVLKEKDGYKISSAKEAIGKYKTKNRLNRLNNEFVVRLPYLYYKDMPNDNVHANQEDVKKYNEEKLIIESFFNGLKVIDSNRMKLLNTNWEKGMNEFTDFITKLSEDKPADEKTKKLIDTMEMTADYKKNFDLSSFPLKLNMERIKGEYRNFQVMPHPAYSENQKRYIVLFEAPIQKQNGVLDNEIFYKFDYFVTLSKSENAVKVGSIRLNQHSTVKK